MKVDTNNTRVNGTMHANTHSTKVPIFSRLATKVAIGLLGIIIVGLSGISLFFNPIIHSILKKQAGQNSVLVVQQVADKVTALISRREEYIRAITGDHDLQQALYASNAHFDVLPDRETYITQQDTAWSSASAGTTTPLMDEIARDSASTELQKLTSFFTEENGYPVYSEMILTNKYGVNVGMTDRTSDYYQADEVWWQDAVHNGTYISNVTYDQSSRKNVIDMAVAIRDSRGALVGVLKASLDLQQVFDVINSFVPDESAASAGEHLAHGHSAHGSMDIMFIEATDTLVYETSHEHATGTEQKAAIDELNQHRSTHAEDGYYYATHIGTGDVLVTYAHMSVRDWTLALEYRVSDVLDQANTAITQASVLLILIASLAFFTTLLFIVKFVVQPIMKLDAAATAITNGDLTTHVVVHGSGEIRHLGDAFNAMTLKLRDSQEHLEEKIAERTKELEKARVELQDKLDDLEKFQEVTVGRELKMVELKEKNIELEQKLQEAVEKRKDSS